MLAGEVRDRRVRVRVVSAHCVCCGTEVSPVLDTLSKVDHWVDSDGHATATDIPDAYEMLQRLGDRRDIAAMSAYSTLSVRLREGMSFHQHQGAES